MKLPPCNVACRRSSAGTTPSGSPTAWVLGAGDDPEPAAVYVGNRPTVYGESGQRVVEAHLLNFDGDLYDRELSVRFIARIRGDEAFASFEDLVAQIRRDCDDARAILESASDRREL